MSLSPGYSAATGGRLASWCLVLSCFAAHRSSGSSPSPLSSRPRLATRLRALEGECLWSSPSSSGAAKGVLDCRRFDGPPVKVRRQVMGRTCLESLISRPIASLCLLSPALSTDVLFYYLLLLFSFSSCCCPDTAWRIWTFAGNRIDIALSTPSHLDDSSRPQAHLVSSPRAQRASWVPPCVTPDERKSRATATDSNMTRALRPCNTLPASFSLALDIPRTKVDLSGMPRPAVGELHPIVSPGPVVRRRTTSCQQP
jgi:hypothetical protein